MENWNRRRKLEDFEPIIQQLGTAYQKTDFLAVFDESRPDFWLCQFYAQTSSRYQMPATGAKCCTQKIKVKRNYSSCALLLFFKLLKL
ncbi:hypothetical protein QUB63_17275 [Microcoleus sp. ARI1-B5]|uniref:hypothetical protein n=1 Tax=unclassified Microcoleus TaxID=2642155 RepID=UPI002FD61B4B